MKAIPKKKTAKFTNLWKLNNTLKQPMAQKRNHKGIRQYFETNENENIHTKTYEMQEKPC